VISVVPIVGSFLLLERLEELVELAVALIPERAVASQPCGRIAQRLGLDGTLASHAATRDGRFTGRVDAFLYGSAKAAAVRSAEAAAASKPAAKAVRGQTANAPRKKR